MQDRIFVEGEALENTLMAEFRHVQVVLLAAAVVVFAAPAPSDGLDSQGNTDGVLSWRLGALQPGRSVREVVLLAFADSRDDLVGLLQAARRDFQYATRTAAPSGKSGARTGWIENSSTDFSLDGNGTFFWEGGRQSLRSAAGGQLSRFSYRVHYSDGKNRQAGASITKRGALENLRVIDKVRAVDGGRLLGRLETEDGKLRLRIRATMGKGPVSAVEFVVTNAGGAPLDDVRLSVYSNLEANHDHENDYGVLDPEIGGLLTIDPPTGRCVAMAGLTRPAGGYSGVWPSEQALRNGAGVPISKWTAFEGMTEARKERIARASIPHPPAPYVEPVEPETRTLTEAEAAGALERDWLFQADGKPSAARAAQEIRWARELADRLARGANPPDLRVELAALPKIEERMQSLQNGKPNPAAEKEIYLTVRRIKRRIVFENPVVDFSKVLFIDNPYPQGAEWAHEARHRNAMMAVPGGRLLLLDGLRPGGRVRKLAPDAPGSFWRPDLSFDARRVLFCFKPHDEKAFHLYEVGLDGDGLRQLTFGDYDDLDPIYLPDGHILFSTTRCNTYIRCMPYTYSYVLARCDGDGKNVYILSRGNEPDWLPALLHDGRVIYTRWEYTDKALWRIQSLWTTNPDGTNTSVFWGNQSVWPDMLVEPRPIPGSRRVMFTGAAHHNWFDGSIGIIDPTKGLNFPHGLTKVTADVAWPECGPPPLDPIESPHYHRAGRFDAYKTPYPLGEEDFLVSARAGGRYRLYLMDVHGNRELIYEGAHHIWHAIPVRPRARPPVPPDRVAWPGTGRERRQVEPGVLFSANVYQGVPDLPNGKARYLRVIQMDSHTWSTWTRDARFSGPAISLVQDDGVKRILGTVPVEPDGSVHFRVPAGKALHFQLLGEDFRALQTMRSFTGVMPGERRGCVGCHEMHSAAAAGGSALAMRREPDDPTPPPWGAKSIDYEDMVQPVLDRYCGRCHQGEGGARKALDLTLRPGFRFFKEPYVTLIGKANYGNAGRNEMTPPDKPPIAGALLCENFGPRDPKSYETFRPMRHLSYTSRLVDVAMGRDESEEEHRGLNMDPESLRKLIGWVDANCPYRGEDEVRRIADPDFPGIEALPIRPRCRTAPVIARP